METQNPPRRIFMRQVLLSGCALAAPAFIAACGKNEGNSAPAKNESAPAANEQNPAGPASNSSAMNAAAGNKVSKETANYQDHPKGNNDCAGCQYYIAESGTCVLVAGTVSPTGWCTYWASKG